MIKESGLRGRGGAGFPTGMKWGFMPKEPKPGKPNFLVVNADESEPGSCKDREIIRHDPHKLIEGSLLAGFAMRARAGYIYIRGEFIREAEVLEKAVAEAYDAGLARQERLRLRLRFRPVRPPRRRRVHLRRRDGDAQQPRGQEGLSTAEAPVPGRRGPLRLPDHRQQRRIDRGRADHPQAQRAMVRELRPREERGHQAVPAVGPCEHAVRRRGDDVDQLPGADRRSTAAAFAAARMDDFSNLLAVIPGGSSVPLVPAEEIIDCPMDFDGLKALGSGLGTAAVIVMDKSTDIVRAISRISYFYKHESCGQCTPCREGTGWMWRIMEKLRTGDTEVETIDKLLDVTKQVEGHTICALGDAAAWPIQGLIKHFRPELERRIAERAGRQMLEAAE
jgi:NADH-quinone oxidoreductase subunit F